jgi:flagellar protein FliO/FliZ
VLPTVAAPAAEPARSFAAAGLVQAGLGLALVIGLIFLFAWAARRLGFQPSASGRLLKVVSSTLVGQRERVVVVEIGDAWLVLGVAPGQVSTLHTMPAEKPSAAQAPAPGSVNDAGSVVFSQKLIDSMSRLTKLKRD